MRPREFDFDLDAVDADGLADGVDSSVSKLALTGALTSGADLDGIADNNDSSGTSLTLDGVLVSGGVYVAADDKEHHIRILDTATVDQSGATFTITGKNIRGQEIIEAVTGPASGAFVESTNRFASISSITIANGAGSGTVDVGPNGVYASVDGLAHRISILDTATQDQSDSTFTVTGLDADGRVQSEAITGPGSGATVTSTKYFKEVYNVAISGGDASDTVDVGTVDEVASSTFVLDHYQSIPLSVQAVVTGTINFDLQVTLKNPMQTLTDQESMAWSDDSNFTSINASKIDTLGNAGLRAMRFIANSYSTGAEVQLYCTQPRGV